MKNQKEKYPHLTVAKTGYACYVSVPDGQAPEFSKTLANGMARHNLKMSPFVRKCVNSGVQEPEYQRRNKHAMALIDRFDDGLDECEALFVADLRMALTGCPTRTNTSFTGELSREYIERYGDEPKGTKKC